MKRSPVRSPALRPHHPPGRRRHRLSSAAAVTDTTGAAALAARVERVGEPTATGVREATAAEESRHAGPTCHSELSSAPADLGLTPLGALGRPSARSATHSQAQPLGRGWRRSGADLVGKRGGWDDARRSPPARSAGSAGDGRRTAGRRGREPRPQRLAASDTAPTLGPARPARPRQHVDT